MISFNNRKRAVWAGKNSSSAPAKTTSKVKKLSQISHMVGRIFEQNSPHSSIKSQESRLKTQESRADISELGHVQRLIFEETTNLGTTVI
ncbi:unnamed protein product [Ambrosiozyma monospora]|uniref:Unnamed protein product n=1 Tax=Ambrosiozyma monospora TaxID=43982 RepID=A0A9W6Z0V2_AMBMO|nr:unnamed protein product [Ambrosiozyma monospora]